MSRLAVIGTFHGRHEESFPLLYRLYAGATRRPDEAWLMCEDDQDAQVLHDAHRELVDRDALDGWPDGLNVVVHPTPMVDGRYGVIPYANKINWALDRTRADYIVYLDNGSMPGPEKYEVMVAALDQHPSWGAVYCTQQRTGYVRELSVAEAVVPDAYCRLNYTQVMHRRTADRWPLDMGLADPDVADGHFWRLLHARLGPFFPVGGPTVHDDHHMPAQKAAGI